MKYSKDGITVAPMIDTGHPKLNGLYLISIRVSYQRRRKYYPTGKDLLISEWEQIETTKSHRLVCIRKDIKHSYNVVRDAVEELANTSCFTLDALNTRLKGAGSNTLNDAFREKITALKREKRIGSAAFYTNVLQGIERYAGTHIRFNTVTPDWLTRYSNFLRQEGKTQTTIAIHMRHTRAILNAAKRCGKITEAQFPFGVDKFKIQEGEGRKLALTLAQIGEIARYDNGLTAAAKYRDYWLFLYYCNGINVADFVKLKYSNIIDGEIAFVRQKTERTTRIRKEIRATLIEPMRAIIDRWGNTPMYDNYIFPILDGT